MGGGVLVEWNFLVAAFPSVTFVGLTTYQSAEHLTVDHGFITFQ